MDDRVRDRLDHIKVAIQNIRALLDDKTFDSLRTEKVTRAAFERFLEIISEASRYVPEEWKAAEAPDIEWPGIAALGNQIRHVYQRLDLQILWDVYQNDLGPLEAAIDDMIDRHFPADPASPNPLSRLPRQ